MLAHYLATTDLKRESNTYIVERAERVMEEDRQGSLSIWRRANEVLVIMGGDFKVEIFLVPLDF